MCVGGMNYKCLFCLFQQTFLLFSEGFLRIDIFGGLPGIATGRFKERPVKTGKYVLRQTISERRQTKDGQQSDKNRMVNSFCNG